jgi:glycogen debranching enzyme
MMSEVKRLELRHDQDLDAKLFKLKLGSKLRLTVSAGIYAEDVRVFTSYPADGYPHDRKHLRELQWTYSTPQCNWDIDRYIDVTLTRSGPYRIVWTLGEDLSGVLSGHCYFIVEPDLGYSPNSISCQTHITKLLGPLNQWKQRLMVAWKSGYNMIHFTPPHQLGSSRSAYSISNQLKMDSAYLPSGYSHVTTPISCTDACGKELSLEVDGSFVELKQLIDDLRTNHGVLSIVDVVWNHTSFDTPWLIQHPEAGYNLFNSPHLRPAYKLDSVIYQFSCEIANGQWISHGIHPHISSEHDIRLICDRLLDTVLPQAKLWEYFSVDVEAIVKEFRSSVYRLNGGEHPCPEGKHLTICQDSQYRRLGSTVNKTLTIELFNVIKSGAVCFEERMEQCCNDLRNVLRNLNTEIEDKTRHSLYEAVNNIAATMRYQFLEGHGPKRYHITVDRPFVDRYFVKVGGGAELNDEEIEGGKGLNVLAHNGWVMNADPLVNFAEEGSNVYFKRELIVWGDSVKLRYGSGPSDSQWLWDHMTLYTRIMAWVFDGFRLDNCHNTPIHVAEGLLDSARDVNHNLYLVAELFTPSEERDNYFVNRLGINSLIREAMFAHNPRELGRLVYKYGGLPVASFFNASSLQPSTPHAMFLDATHDNEPGHILSRSVQDALPNTALMAIASCASGSCRGYDELVPHKIEVVSEKRLYPGWSDSTSPSPHPWSTIDHTHGLIEAKRLLNQLHQQLAEEGYHEIFVDQVTEEIIAVTRHCSTNHKSFILMAHCAFHTPPDWATPTFNNPQTHFNSVPSLTVQGSIKGIHMEAKLVRDDKRQALDHTPSPHYVNGLDQYRLDISHLIPLDQSTMCHLISNNSPIQEVIFTDFSPGSIIIFEVELLPEAADSVKFIRSFLGCEKTNPDGCGLASRLSSEVSSLSFTDLNYVLYRCDNEEKADSKGGGAYIVPNIGPMTYCGLQGIMNMIKPIRETNDLGHPLCDNLRSGHWLLGYTSNRLNLRPSIKRLHEIISNIFHHLTLLPHYLIPSYFDAVISQIFQLMIDTCYSKMNQFVANGSSFVKLLALGSVQLYGDVPSATLPPYLKGMDTIGSLAAGLPHFSVGFMRCWGRDTFIALRGLLMVTGRFDEARSVIVVCPFM